MKSAPVRTSLLIAGILAIATVGMHRAGGQSPGEFDVTSIKPNQSGSDGTSINTLPGGRFVATNASLKMLIESAFGVKDFQIAGGPRWLDATSYDIEAKVDRNGRMSDEELRPYLQALLADRFKLKFHRETKEVSVYSLVVGKTGSKLAEHTGTGEPSGRTLFGSGKASMSATKVTTKKIAEVLSQVLSRTVVDNTGLSGMYDLKLEWVPDQTAESTGPSIFTALQEQLGLKLESTRGPVEVLIIDSAEKPSEN